MSVLVSINCITYNHEHYIADAIEGFLMQKTNFDFEIIIGEDCSTDNTMKIVQEYKQKYPDKIRVITSDKNVGANKNALRVHENSRGKYIAICEGDDYWTDPLKLQKQVTYMENNPNCTLCFHSAEIIKANKKLTGKFLGLLNKENKMYSAGNILSFEFIPTASFMYLKRLMDNPPKWYEESIVGDLPLSLIVSSHGYAYYIDEVMSVYRTGVKGSIMYKWKNENSVKQNIELHERYIYILYNFNDYSNYKFSYEVEKAALLRKFEILILEKNMKEVKSLKYKVYFDAIGVRKKVKIYFRYYFPRVYTKLISIKAKIKKLIYNI
jgi:glycosyltransferase involved in cell wall biosynthesis